MANAKFKEIKGHLPMYASNPPTEQDLKTARQSIEYARFEAIAIYIGIPTLVIVGVVLSYLASLKPNP